MRFASAQDQLVLRGTVHDSTTGEPLAAANIRIAGTQRGTITNSAGAFSLSCAPGDSLVIFSYLGYQPDSIRPSRALAAPVSILLRPSPITISEVLVLGEDPAVDIIRKAIANKHKWMDQLHTYQFEAYTRQVLRRDTAIASITEAFTTGYAARGDTMREIVKQKRQTSNIPVEQNFAAVRNVVNFNDDEIDLFRVRANDATVRFVFAGPTAPDALDNYDVHLLKTRRLNGLDIYEIDLRPKNHLKPLFDGTITIASGTYAVMGVDVRPTALQTIPFVADLKLRYRQEFSLVDSIFWMPTTMHITGGFSVAFFGISLPHIGIEQLSSLSEYKINVPLPDSMRSKPRVTVDSAAVELDTTYWRRADLIPLTTEEAQAYSSIDSSATLEKQFKPSGPVAMLGERGAEALLGSADVRYNRVEGLYLGGQKGVSILQSLAQLRGSAGYAFGLKEAFYSIAVIIRPLRNRLIGLEGSLYSLIDHRPDEQLYGTIATTIASVIDGSDPHDYFSAHGYSLAMTTHPTRWFDASIGFRSEREASRSNTTSFSFVSRPEPFRKNPAIDDGLLRALSATVQLGSPSDEVDLIGRTGVSLEVEHSSPTIARSEFSFTRYAAIAEWTTRTFAGGFLFPPMLRVRTFAGYSTGELPPQRMFAADPRLGGYAAFGALRGARADEIAGDRLAVVNLEHNFRTLPFVLAGIPYFADHTLELLAHASFAQAWRGTTPLVPGWYAEAGVGVSRVFDLFRVDIGRRFTPPAGTFFTIGFATIF